MSRFPSKRPNMRPSGYSSERARPHDWDDLKREFLALNRDTLDPAKKLSPRINEGGLWIGIIGERKDGSKLEMSFDALRESASAREDRYFDGSSDPRITTMVWM